VTFTLLERYYHKDLTPKIPSDASKWLWKLLDPKSPNWDTPKIGPTSHSSYFSTQKIPR